jgi:putative RNA 2'-phosphotransferase
MNKVDVIKISKYLSYILRHKPESIGIKLSESGWCTIDELIEKTTEFDLTKPHLKLVVKNNDKQRFTFNLSGTMIRANQGHSVEVDLDLKPITPPKRLFHGTATKSLKSIKKKGLTKQNRHHVHLSDSIGTAFRVGQRHGKPAVLFIECDKIFKFEAISLFLG